MVGVLRALFGGRRYLVMVMLSGFMVGLLITNVMQTNHHVTHLNSIPHDLDSPAIRIHRPEDTSIDEIKPEFSGKQLNESSQLLHKPKKPTTIPPEIKRRMGLANAQNNYYKINKYVSPDAATTKLADSLPQIHVDACDCDKILKGDPTEIDHAVRYQDQNPKMPIPDSAYVDLTKNCDKFKQERQYVSKPLSTEEATFPIAYSIMAFKDVEMFERVLRAVYHPQNYYCIHVDKKSPSIVREAIKAITNCFSNVQMASRTIEVQWAWFSVLEPDLVCMNDLWKYKKWKYFINLTGQEFPLKTNADLVRILKTYNGANNMEGTEQRRNVMRTEFVHEGFVPTNQRKGPPPGKVRLTKGSVHVTASRDFVDFVLHNPMALKFQSWVKDTGVPDETFFSSLNHSPQIGVPGAYTGSPETHPLHYPFLTRYKNWGLWPFDWPCAGQRVRLVCIFGVGDLNLLSSRPELFANKFYLDYQPLAFDCMERLHYQRMREEVLGQRELDTTYYESLSFVKNHV